MERTAAAHLVLATVPAMARGAGHVAALALAAMLAGGCVEVSRVEAIEQANRVRDERVRAVEQSSTAIAQAQAAQVAAAQARVKALGEQTERVLADNGQVTERLEQFAKRLEQLAERLELLAGQQGQVAEILARTAAQLDDLQRQLDRQEIAQAGDRAEQSRQLDIVRLQLRSVEGQLRGTTPAPRGEATAECKWLGKRTILTLLRDDLIAAEGLTRLYTGLGCPVGYLGQAFGCTVRAAQVEPKSNMEAPAEACWVDPKTTRS